jgi:hypothetical protein
MKNTAADAVTNRGVNRVEKQRITIAQNVLQHHTQQNAETYPQKSVLGRNALENLGKPPGGARMKSEMESPSDSAANTPRMIIPESIQGRRRSRGKSALSARKSTAID